MKYAEFFSGTYDEARSRFRAAVEKAGGDHKGYEIGVDGPNGTGLTIDMARIGPDTAERVLVLSSGTHGVEGFFGSAAQLAALARAAGDEALPEGVALVLIHAMNPYGFAYVRRVNEDNIDLNRNFLTEDQSHEGTDPAYRKLDPMLNPESPPGGLEFFFGRTVINIVRHGYRALKNAVVQGQYDFPQGLFYGGKKPTATVNLLDEHLPTWVKDAKRVIHLDWHTGMGKWGTYILGTSRSIDDPETEWLKERFGAQSVEALDPSGVLYEIRGVLGSWLEARFPDREYHCLLAEFGTYPSLKMLRALRQENRAHHWGEPEDPHTEIAKRELKEAFAPADSAWRESAITQALGIVDQAISALTA